LVAVAAIERPQDVVERHEVDAIATHGRRARHRPAGTPTPFLVAVLGIEAVEVLVVGADEEPVVKRAESGGPAAEAPLPDARAVGNLPRDDPAVLEREVEAVGGHRGTRCGPRGERLAPEQLPVARAQHQRIAVHG